MDELAATADKHPPYVELEHLAYREFGLAALSHRVGALGWPEPMPAAAVQTVDQALALAGAGDAITAQAMLRPDRRLRRLSLALRVPISVLARSQDPLSALHHDLIDRLRAACEARQAALGA